MSIKEGGAFLRGKPTKISQSQIDEKTIKYNPLKSDIFYTLDVLA